MLCKFLERRRTFLRDHRKIGRADAKGSSDFNPPFLADANRELRRALDWYSSLKGSVTYDREPFLILGSRYFSTCAFGKL